MREFTHDDIIKGTWGNWSNCLNAILDRQIEELWEVPANGWYYCQNLMYIGSLDECLKYMGFSSLEEYNTYAKKCSCHSEGFWSYELKRVNIKEYVDRVVNEAIRIARFEWEDEERPRVEKEAQKKMLDKWYACKDILIHDINNYLSQEFKHLAEK